jgi:hypothetical protein
LGGVGDEHLKRTRHGQTGLCFVLCVWPQDKGARLHHHHQFRTGFLIYIFCYSVSILTSYRPTIFPGLASWPSVLQPRSPGVPAGSLEERGGHAVNCDHP